MKLRTNADGTMLRLHLSKRERARFKSSGRKALLKVAALAVTRELDNRRESKGSDQDWSPLRIPGSAQSAPLQGVKYKVVSRGENTIRVGSPNKWAAVHDKGVDQIIPTKHHALFIPLTARAKSGYRRGAFRNDRLQSLKPYHNPKTGKMEMRSTSPRTWYSMTEHVNGVKAGHITFGALVPGRVANNDFESTPMRFEAAKKADRLKGRKPDFVFFRSVSIPQRRQYVLTADNLRNIGMTIRDTMRS